MLTSVVPGGRWPREGTVAMDDQSGRRVAFGSRGAPPARIDEAVTASCAIPGWYAPVLIGGRRCVDGGTVSATSVDLLAAPGLDRVPDEVLVLAPMASFATDSPGTVAGRLERAGGVGGSLGRCCATPAGSSGPAPGSPCWHPVPMTSPPSAPI